MTSKFDFSSTAGGTAPTNMACVILLLRKPSARAILADVITEDSHRVPPRESSFIAFIAPFHNFAYK